MLVGMKKIMQVAQEKQFGVPALFASNEDSLRSAIEAAQEKNSPLIVLLNYGMIKDFEVFCKYAREIAQKVDIPIALILDHGKDLAEAVWAIKAGLTDIMIDKSSCTYQENMMEVKRIVEIAHSVGMGVEAELGHVGQGDNYAIDGHQAFTVLEEAKKFVEKTGCDFLAVAIGTAHGVYKGTPEIHFDLLKELKENVAVPLVLHGGSGSGDDNLAKACKMGICKVNIANDLYRAAATNLVLSDFSGNKAYYIYDKLKLGYKACAMHYMDVCGSTNKKELYL